MTDSPESGLRAMNAAIRLATADDAIRQDARGFFAAQGAAGPDLEALLERNGERMLVYRQLVHNRIRHAIRDLIPRVVARIGAERFGRDFAAFMQSQAPRSPYLRDVPSEFVGWIGPRWRDDPETPPYLFDLARHELLETDVLNDPHGDEIGSGEGLDIDAVAVFDGTARLMRYDWAVHKLPYDTTDRTEPRSGLTQLLVFRDAQPKVRYFELTPWAAHVVHALMTEQSPLGVGLQRAAQAMGDPLDDDKLAATATLLAHLGEVGVLLGGRRTR